MGKFGCMNTVVYGTLVKREDIDREKLSAYVSQSKKDGALPSWLAEALDEVGYSGILDDDTIEAMALNDVAVSVCNDPLFLFITVLLDDSDIVPWSIDGVDDCEYCDEAFGVTGHVIGLDAQLTFPWQSFTEDDSHWCSLTKEAVEARVREVLAPFVNCELAFGEYHIGYVWEE